MSIINLLIFLLEASQIQNLEKKIDLLHSKYFCYNFLPKRSNEFHHIPADKHDECLNWLKIIDHKLDTLLCQDAQRNYFPIKDECDLKRVDEKIEKNFDSFVSHN